VNCTAEIHVYLILTAFTKAFRNRLLNEKSLTHGFAQRPVVIVAKAVRDIDGIDTIWVDEPESSLNGLSPE
jgi:hypothetical protein